MTRGHSMPGEMTHDSAMGCGMMSGGGMTAVMAPEPAHLLEMKVELHLTADQERRITAIRDAARPGHDAAMQSGELHARELAQARAVLTDAQRRQVDGMHAAMGQPQPRQPAHRH